MQDFTGVPAVVDLAAMRDAMNGLGGNPKKINPLVPCRPGHRSFGDDRPLRHQDRPEDEHGPGIPPQPGTLPVSALGSGGLRQFPRRSAGRRIRHQVNLENLAKVAWTRKDGKATVVYSDTCVGTDSHTTMVNGLGVLGWGVGGIEAEAAMLGQPVTMLIPEVVGFKMTGRLSGAAPPPPIWC